MASELRPARTVKPGNILRKELDERGWTQKEFAGIIGRPVQMVNEIVNGKKAITPETAFLFSAALGTSPELWLNLENAYRLYEMSSRVDAKAVADRAAAARDQKVTGRSARGKSPAFHLDIVIERKRGKWIAHCLQLDVVASATTEREALAELRYAIDRQVGSAELANLLKPAPPEVWAKLWKAHRSRQGRCTRTSIPTRADGLTFEADVCYA